MCSKQISIAGGEKDIISAKLCIDKYLTFKRGLSQLMYNGLLLSFYDLETFQDLCGLDAEVTLCVILLWKIPSVMKT